VATLSLVPQVVSLALYAGDGAALRVTVRDTVGAPIDLSGAVAAQIRGARGDAGSLADFAVDMAAAATGVVVLTLSGAQTAALVNGTGTFRGAYDVEWTPSGSEPVTLVQGDVTCELDVTRGP
jgi:hypothetical protein